MHRTRLLLLLLLLTGCLAAVGYAVLAPGRGKAIAAPTAPPTTPLPAVITIRAPLPPGHILRPDDLAQVRWANANPPQGAILAGSPEAAALPGAVTRRAFQTGEMLVAGTIITPGERGFLAAIVTPGHRAIAVSVDAVTAAGGLIWPGDRVDVILTQEIRDDGVPLSQRVVSETILYDVRILSADQKLEQAGAAGKGVEGVEGTIEPRRVPATVTLEVAPADAERLTVAATLGRLHLTLRGVASGDGAGSGFQPPATWAGHVSPALTSIQPSQRAVSSAAPERPTASPAEPVTVRIYRGSEGAKG